MTLHGQCGSLMVGSGTDTYDPVCELPEGHKGPCKSTAAVDQHRLCEQDRCTRCGQFGHVSDDHEQPHWTRV